MAIKTSIIPHQTKEEFDDKDREEIHRIISELRHDYL